MEYFWQVGKVNNTCFVFAIYVRVFSLHIRYARPSSAIGQSCAISCLSRYRYAAIQDSPCWPVRSNRLKCMLVITYTGSMLQLPTHQLFSVCYRRLYIMTRGMLLVFLWKSKMLYTQQRNPPNTNDGSSQPLSSAV